MGSKLGAHKAAATRCGCSYAEWVKRREAGERFCYGCRSWKAVAEFAVDRSRESGTASICKPCNNHRSKRSLYRLSAEEYANVISISECPICERSGVPMEIDHNHTTGAVRALLCSRCNSALGMFCEDPELMRRAISYLEKHNG